MPQAKLSDPSGRGKAEGFKVIFPMMQHPYTEAEIQAVVDVMRNAEGQTQGKYLEKFEKDFAAFVGAKYAFGVNNCTNALKLAAIFCHIQPGDEVIVPAYTYCASAIPFGDLGAHIVWADINKDTWTIDPDDFERKITPKTKAVVAVHLLGIPCDMKRIVAIARRHGIKVVEDCYNAAPDSMNAALDTLSGMECEGRKICVFADMRELGSASDESHRAIGQHAARVADKLLVYGPQSHLYVEGANAAGLSDAREYPDRPALTQAVREAVRPGDIVWFKGSLLMNLEEVLRAVFPDAE